MALLGMAIIHISSTAQISMKHPFLSPLADLALSLSSQLTGSSIPRSTLSGILSFPNFVNCSKPGRSLGSPLTLSVFSHTQWKERRRGTLVLLSSGLVSLPAQSLLILLTKPPRSCLPFYMKMVPMALL